MPLATITDNALHNAFPSLVVTGGTNLLLTYRVGSAHNSLGKIVKKTSTDNGNSWSAESNVLTNAAHDYRTGQVRKLANGNLLMLVAVSYWPYTTPWTGFCSAYISTNSGVSWGSPHDIPSGYDGGSCLEAPPCETSDGRILVPVYGTYPGDSLNSVSIVESSDGGVTWGNEKYVHYMGDYSPSDIPGVGCNESVLVRLADDRLLMLMRGDSNIDMFSLCSNDNRRWSSTRRIFRGGGKPNFLQLPNGTLRCIYRAGDGTSNMVLRESYDNGGTWSVERMQATGSFAYSDSAILNDGRMLTVYSMQSGTPANPENADIRAFDYDLV